MKKERMTRTVMGKYRRQMARSDTAQRLMSRTPEVEKSLWKKMEGRPDTDPVYQKAREKISKHDELFRRAFDDVHPHIDNLMRDLQRFNIIRRRGAEISHRLQRDYKIPLELADVAAAIKETKGWDDRPAIMGAKEVLMRSMAQTHGEIETIAEDIRAEGENSKYAKHLNISNVLKRMQKEKI